MDDNLDARIKQAARAIGRVTIWSAHEAEIQIKMAATRGLTVEQCTRLLYAGISPVLVANVLQLSAEK